MQVDCVLKERTRRKLKEYINTEKNLRYLINYLSSINIENHQQLQMLVINDISASTFLFKPIITALHNIDEIVDNILQPASTAELVKIYNFVSFDDYNNYKLKEISTDVRIIKNIIDDIPLLGKMNDNIQKIHDNLLETNKNTIK
jgi:hypothetical protein